jgi:hypothetical protein
MDSATLDLLRVRLTELLGEHRAGRDAPLAQRLATLGWEEVLADDATTATRLLFEARGATLSDADALGPLLARVVADAASRPDLAGATVVIPASLDPRQCSAAIAGGKLRVEGVVLSEPAEGATLVVPVAWMDGHRRLAILRRGAGWSGDRLSGMDETLGVRLRGGAGEADVDWIDEPEARSIWEAATTAARWAVAAELAALGGAVILQAVEYTGQRKQYGRAIGTFQALQHRVAAAYASLVGAAEVTAEASRSGRAWDALVAKALAGKATENACTQAQQCYGAIGFTWEHPFHHYLRRSYVLDRLFGDWRTLEAEIGAALAVRTEVPKIGAI